MKNIITALILIPLLFSCSDNNRKDFGNMEEQVGKNRPMQFQSDEDFLDYIQFAHLNYMVEGAGPDSGLALERIHMDGEYPQNDQDVITTGASGFGTAGLIVGMERGFITREQGVTQLRKIVDFLGKADRYHGAWPHWLVDGTGKMKPFSKKDNGGDLVETAFLIQGLLCARQYLKDGSNEERKLAADIDRLWREVEWCWYQNGQDVLYWHWSPEYGWEMNFPVKGYNEALVMYILGASSPTYPITPEAYHDGWARGGEIISDKTMYELPLVLSHNGAQEYGGPLFWSQYSLGTEPKPYTDRLYLLCRESEEIQRLWTGLLGAYSKLFSRRIQCTYAGQ